MLSVLGLAWGIWLVKRSLQDENSINHQGGNVASCSSCWTLERTGMVLRGTAMPVYTLGVVSGTIPCNNVARSKGRGASRGLEQKELLSSRIVTTKIRSWSYWATGTRVFTKPFWSPIMSPNRCPIIPESLADTWRRRSTSLVKASGPCLGNAHVASCTHGRGQDQDPAHSPGPALLRPAEETPRSAEAVDHLEPPRRDAALADKVSQLLRTGDRNAIQDVFQGVWGFRPPKSPPRWDTGPGPKPRAPVPPWPHAPCPSSRAWGPSLPRPILPGNYPETKNP